MAKTNQFANAIVGLVLAFGLSSVAVAQMPQPQPKPANPSPWKFYPTDRPVGDGGPAPLRDLSGSWAGPSSGMAVPKGTNTMEPIGPPMTALGQQLFSMHKPMGK